MGLRYRLFSFKGGNVKLEAAMADMTLAINISNAKQWLMWDITNNCWFDPIKLEVDTNCNIPAPLT